MAKRRAGLFRRGAPLGCVGLSFSLLAGAPSCATRGDPPAEERPRGEEAPAPDAPASAELRGMLSRYAVYSERFYAPAVFYTWTTAAQRAELAEKKLLLTRAASPSRGLSRFDQYLEAERSGAGEAADIAALLRRPGLSLRRFAWPNPFATLLGWEGETYGEELVAVALKPEAVIGRYEPGRPWRFADRSGAEVPAGEVLSRPERLGAVYFVSPGDGGPPYREYVLCNEAMISAWSLGTPEIADEIAAELTALRALRGYVASAPLGASPERFGAEAEGAWAGPAAVPTLAALYAAALAFPNGRYLPTPENLDALIAALSALPSGAPLTVAPGVAFSLDAPAALAATPAVAPAACVGTFCPPRAGAPPPPPPPAPRPRPPGGVYGTY